MDYWDDEIEQTKIRFIGRIISVQVRSTVWRYLVDNRTHREIGYNIFMNGRVQYPDSADNAEGGNGNDASHKASETETDFSVAISEKQLQKLQPHICDVIQGTAWTEKYPEWEYADYYRAGALKKVESGISLPAGGPPWLTDIPDLNTFAWRGARMLDTRCYKGKCFQCKWAAMANVTIEYNWGKTQKFRFESFCYGPKNCKFYKMGRPRAVPYKGLGTFYDEGWLDEITTENRGEDD